MRSFTTIKIISNDRRINSKNVGGRFQSANPASAAKKAGSSICRQYNINKSIKFNISIQEITRGSNNKIFTYTFSRKYNPVTVMRSGQQITYEFETKVKSLTRSVHRDGRKKPVLYSDLHPDIDPDNIDDTALNFIIFDDDEEQRQRQELEAQELKAEQERMREHEELEAMRREEELEPQKIDGKRKSKKYLKKRSKKMSKKISKKMSRKRSNKRR